MKIVTEVCGFVLGAALVLAMCLYGTFATGFCLSKLWLWYAVPIGFPVLDWKFFGVLAQGLYVLRPARGPKVEGRSAAMMLCLAPWFALFIGWVLL